MISYWPWCKNISSFGTSGSYSSFYTDMSQIESLLSSLATAITDYSFGWKAIEVIGSVCQLKHRSYSLLLFLHILKSQTFTKASSPPVTIKCFAILFQSATFTSLSWAFIFNWAFLVYPTLISTIWRVPSDEPKLRKIITWTKNKILIRRINDIFNWRSVVMISSQGAPSSVILVVGENGNFTSLVSNS